jgi:lysozyme
MATIQKNSILKHVAVPLLTVAALLINFEGGARDTPYVDNAGVLTVCVGSTARGPGGAPIDVHHIYTAKECAARLQNDLGPTYAAVVKSIHVQVTDGEVAAYTSFSYNVGLNSWNHSTALRLLNSGNHVAACNSLMNWVYIGKNRVRGLVNRRQAELDLCLAK